MCAGAEYYNFFGCKEVALPPIPCPIELVTLIVVDA